MLEAEIFQKQLHSSKNVQTWENEQHEILIVKRLEQNIMNNVCGVTH